MALTLIVLNGPGKGQVFRLTGEQPEVIGRQAPRVCVADTETSRQHAEIRCENDTWIIRDLGSTNGTYVNGRRLTGLTELEEGDQILVGRVMLVVGQMDTASKPSARVGEPDDTAMLADMEPLDDEMADAASVTLPPRRDVAPDLIRLDDEFEPAQTADAPADSSVIDAVEPDDAEAPAPEQGYLATHADLMELAGLLDDDDEAALPPPSTPETALDAELIDDVEEAAAEAEADAAADLPQEAAEAAEVAEALTPTESEDPDPLAELARLNADRANADANGDAQPADSASADEVPAPGEADQFGEADQADGIGSGTGLLHHIDLPGDTIDAAGDTGDDAITRDEHPQIANGSLPPTVTFASDGDDADDADAQAHAQDAATGEQGVNLAEMGPPPDDAEEQPTTIIRDAVQTHRPYDQRAPLIAVDHGDVDGHDDDQEPPPLPAADEAGDVAVETGAWADAPAAPEAMESEPPAIGPRRPRRFAAALLSVLLLGMGALGLWYALQAGYIDWPRRVGEVSATPVSPVVRGPATEAAAPEPPEAWPVEAPPDSVAEGIGTDSQNRVRDQAPRALIEAALPRGGAGGSKPEDAIEATSPAAAAPSGDALADAPRLMGGVVLAERVARQTRPLDALIDNGGEDVAPAPHDVEGLPADAGMTPPPPPTTIDAAAPPVGAADPVPAHASPQVEPATVPQSTAQPQPASRTASRRVAFLVDASGSLLDSLDDVIDWLGGRLDRLDPQVQFTVLFFRGGEAIEVPPAGLRHATDDAIGDVKHWIAPAQGHILPSGRSDPLATLQRALSYGVDEIVLISDDSFSATVSRDQGAASVRRIDELIREHGVVMHTVQFFYEDPRHVLQRLAERHGGTYRFVSPAVPTGPDPLGLLHDLSAAPAMAPQAQ